MISVDCRAGSTRRRCSGWRTAPYLHDGSALSLKARILSGQGSDRHGKTSLLSLAEIDDLVSYLKSLEID